jgi:hypothetical protein
VVAAAVLSRGMIASTRAVFEKLCAFFRGGALFVLHSANFAHFVDFIAEFRSSSMRDTSL